MQRMQSTQETLQDETTAIEALYGPLAELGVTHAHVEWTGSSDESFFETMGYVHLHANEDGTATTSDVTVPFELDAQVRDAIQDYVVTKYGDIDGECGGRGTAVICVDERLTKMEHGWVEETMEMEHPHTAGQELSAKDRARLDTQETYRKIGELQQTAYKNEARWAAIMLLDEIEAHPEDAVDAIQYEVDWQYDDEGEYFATVSVYAYSAGEQVESDWVHHSEAASGWSREAWYEVGSELTNIGLDRLRELAGR